MTDHPSPCVKERQNPGDCELEALARRFGSTAAATRPPRDRAAQGRVVAGHRRRSQRLHPLRSLRPGLRRDQGKPRHRPHGQRDTRRGSRSTSTCRWGHRRCVACGECSDDCPTGALTHRRVIETKLARRQRRHRRRSCSTPRSPRSARRSRACRSRFCAPTFTRSSAVSFARER